MSAEKRLSLATEIKQQQRLTPLQVQFVRMLEMTGPEMEDEVQRALDEMPALEAVDPETEMRVQSTEDGDIFTESERDMQRADFRSDDDIPDYLEKLPQATSAPTETGSIFEPRQASGHGGIDPISFPDAAAPTTGESLIDSLNSQLSELPLSDVDAHIVSYIIGSIDDNGYMTRPIASLADDLAINESIDVSPGHITRLWNVVRDMEPAGVGATDLRDCLALQLRRLPRSAESLTALEIIEKHFDLFSKKHFDRIASAMGITHDDVQRALAVISRLNPKPGSALSSSPLEERTRHITPDFSVEADAAGNLTLTLLNRIPELRIEATFANEDSLPGGEGKRFEEARLFIKRKRNDARNFIKVVELRQETLFNVMAAIAKLQHDFFITEADEDIRPMVLRDIAAITGYNLSVISRATQGKYVATLRGIYPLKKFFNEQLREGDDTVTANRIISRIKQAISSENPASPLSDREITEQLAADGFDIARRTVAKYRESLGFPVARLRKKS